MRVGTLVSWRSTGNRKAGRVVVFLFLLIAMAPAPAPAAPRVSYNVGGRDEVASLKSKVAALQAQLKKSQVNQSALRGSLSGVVNELTQIKQLNENLAKLILPKEPSPPALSSEQQEELQALQGTLRQVKADIDKLEAAVESGVVDKSLVQPAFDKLAAKAETVVRSIAAIVPDKKSESLPDLPTQINENAAAIDELRAAVSGIAGKPLVAQANVRSVGEVGGGEKAETKSVADELELIAFENGWGRAGYKKGFFIRGNDESFALKINARVQSRVTYANAQQGDVRSDEVALSIPRARLKLSGYVLDSDVRYAFQMDLGKGNVSLKDFYVDYRIVPSYLHIRAGQWKRPFSRQQITSSGSQAFVDRSITDKAFKAGRDIGLALHNNFKKAKGIEWAVGVFNGTGDKPQLYGDVVLDQEGGGEIAAGGFSNVPDRFAPAVVGRVGYNHGGIKGYSEADLQGGGLRFAVAASTLFDLGLDNDNHTAWRSELDYIVKLYGFSATGGVYHSRVESPDAAVNTVGTHVQVGYVIKDWVQPALRYAYVSPEGAGNDSQEVAGAVSVYFIGHKLKWQSDFAALVKQVSGADPVEYRLRSQLQLAF